jgi:hypothetical protein
MDGIAHEPDMVVGSLRIVRALRGLAPVLRGFGTRFRLEHVNVVLLDSLKEDMADQLASKQSM